MSKSFNVLIIEDCKADMKLMHKTLDSECSIIEETSYEEGLIRLSVDQDNIDFVILDYQLCSSFDRDSYNISKKAEGLNIPYVFFSGNQYPPKSSQQIPESLWICKDNLNLLKERIVDAKS